MECLRKPLLEVMHTQMEEIELLTMAKVDMSVHKELHMFSLSD